MTESLLPTGSWHAIGHAAWQVYRAGGFRPIYKVEPMVTCIYSTGMTQEPPQPYSAPAARIFARSSRRSR